MEEGQMPAGKEGGSSMDMEEIRRRRLAYFQNGNPQKGQRSADENKASFYNHGMNRTNCSTESNMLKDETRRQAKTTEFHFKVDTDKGKNTTKMNQLSEEYITYTDSKVSRGKYVAGMTESKKTKRRDSSSSNMEIEAGQLSKLSNSRTEGSVKPLISKTTPHFSNVRSKDKHRLGWASNEDLRESGDKHVPRLIRKSGDKDLELMFNNRKSTAAHENPALSLKESMDIDCVSVFKSKADFEDLGLSTHRPESTVNSSVTDFSDRQKLTKQRSMSSDNLLLGSQTEEIKTLLGEQKYREFVEKSERELGHLHKFVDAPSTSSLWNGGVKAERLSRIDASPPRNTTPTPPPQSPSPQPQSAGPSRQGPSPRRRLRSSSPQMVSKTLQDIARTKESREAGLSRNYEQVVVPHNVTFSADEIYRQAFGAESTTGNDVRSRSSSSLGSSFQDPGSSFWNNITPRQMAGGMSPTSPHAAPVFPPQFSPKGAGTPLYPPPPQPVHGGNPLHSGTYFYHQGGVPISMAGGGQYMYPTPRQQNTFMPMSPASSSQSPDPYLYNIHPLSQTVPSFHTSDAPMHNPLGMSWQHGQQGLGASKDHGQRVQVNGPHSHSWNQFGHGGQHSGGHYRQENPGMSQMPHPPTRSLVSSIGGGDTDRSKVKSSAEHADAVRHYHEQRHQAYEGKAHINHSQADGTFSNSSLERYFASLGMPPPNYPPPSYHHHHQAPPPHHPLQQDTHRSDSDYDDMTMVTRTSAVTGTSIKAGGITERLEQIGIDPLIIHSLKHRSDTAAADEEALQAMRTMVRICPECQAVNKEYMTWCLHCGGVLIGVDPIPAKDLKKRNKEKKGSNSLDSSSKLKKTSSEASIDEAVSVEVKRCDSQESTGKGKTVPIKVQHVKNDNYDELDKPMSVSAHHNSTQEPFLEFEETIEEEVIYQNFDEDRGQERSELEEIAQDTPAITDLRMEELGMEEEAAGTKESPESGRGASASSSPCRRNVSRELSDDAAESSQNTLELTENKDSGRPSSGEGTESRKPQISSQMVPEDGPRRSDKEISEICEVINDPIIRGFIKNYLQKKRQDPHPLVTQPPSNQKRNSQTKDVAGKQSKAVTQQNQTGVSQSLSLDLEASVNSNLSAHAKAASTKSKKTETPKKKVHKRTIKKGHEAIDVEIFAIEEAKLSRSARSGANIVPKLNLALSSDEEDDSSENTSSLHGGPSVNLDASSDTSSPRDDFAPINYSTEVKNLTTQMINFEEENNNIFEPSHSKDSGSETVWPNRAEANSNFMFLQQAVESQQAPTASQGKKPSQVRPQPQQRPNPTSKVRASIEAPPPNRRWMRSSIAWSSYHPRELRTRSSVNFSQGPVGAPGRKSSGNVQVSRSTDNLANRAPAEVNPTPSQRPRPSSADQQSRRGANRGRPSSVGRGRRPFSAGHIPTPQTIQSVEATQTNGAGDRTVQEQTHSRQSMADSPRCSETDIEGRPIHRLAVQEDTLPLIPTGPKTASKIYDRCCETSPRSEFDQVSKWLLLPDELWIHVFTNLAQADFFNVLQTCKQLYRVAVDTDLWKCVTVRKKSLKDDWLDEIAKRRPLSLALVQCYGDQVSENALRQLFKEIGPELKELNFSRCSKGKMIGDEILLHASTHCRQLTHIDASWCHVTDVGLSAIAECCNRIESLCLNGCQQITDESLKIVMEKHGNSLRLLELFGCFSLTPVSFRRMGEHCTFLLTLNMGQCKKITDSSMVTLSASLGRVETLDLRGCQKLEDNSIRKIVRNCRRIRNLSLANCPLVSNAAIVEIATYATDIRSLDVCGCSRISDNCIQTLASNCYRLTSIDISSTGCTYRSVLMLAESSRNLEIAKFNFLTDVHEKSLAKLIRNCKSYTL